MYVLQDSPIARAHLKYMALSELALKSPLALKRHKEHGVISSIEKEIASREETLDKIKNGEKGLFIDDARRIYKQLCVEIGILKRALSVYQ